MEENFEPVSRVELETELIRQEDRPWILFRNFFWKRFEPSDPRYHAASEAFASRLFWSLLTPVAAGGASLLALISVLQSCESNRLVKEQNSIITQLAENETDRAAQEDNLNKMFFSVRALMNLSTEWYNQIRDMTVLIPPQDKELTEFSPQLALYVENRDVVPEYKLHVLILKENYPKSSAVVEQAEKILVLLTDYDPKHPAKRIVCSSMYEIPDWETSLLPKLDEYLQTLAIEAAKIMGPSVDVPEAVIDEKF